MSIDHPIIMTGESVRAIENGRVGDRLWVQEDFAYYPDGDHVIYKEREGKELAELGIDLKGCWKPSIHMPKKHARLWLEITGIRKVK